MAELHRPRIATMFPTDPHLETGAGLSSFVDRHANQPPDSVLVQYLEWILGEDTLLHVRGKEPPRIVPAQPKGGLGQVVRPERKELGRSSDVTRHQRRPGKLDHRTYRVANGFPHSTEHLFGLGHQNVSLVLEFLPRGDERHHQLGPDIDP